ncbi:MAG TPA: CoA transferase [Hyphomicrobiaceae bacterium]|nr:CoA transferase [Hyphomicrobiaceae bacterium]
MSFERAYEGLRVVDLSQGIAGPYCAMLLAQHGADVIKVEPPEGDWSRVLGKVQGDHAAFSIAGNLGKRSIAVDLKSELGRSIVDRLVAEADIFIEGFRPGVIDRLGFSYDRLKERNPKLIYVSVSGFGQTGPLSKKPAMDPVLQAFSGALDENRGQDGIPHRAPPVYFDMSTAMYALQAVGAALYAIRDGHPGRRINLSLMESAANITTVRLQASVREGPYKPVAAPSGTYRTKNGWIQIAVVKDHEFQKVCQALGLLEFAVDPRFQKSVSRAQHADFLNGHVAELLLTRTSEEWRDILTEGDVQNELVQTYTEFVNHPQPKAIGLISWLPQPGWDELWPVPNPPGLPRLEPGQKQALSPSKGQHSREVLVEFGYTDEEISGFIEAKTILEPPG